MLREKKGASQSIYLSIYLSTYLSIYLFSYLTINLSIYLYIYQSIYLTIYLLIYLSNYLSIYLSIYQSIYLTIYLSIYLSINLSIYLPIYLYSRPLWFPWRWISSSGTGSWECTGRTDHCSSTTWWSTGPEVPSRGKRTPIQCHPLHGPREAPPHAAAGGCLRRGKIEGLVVDVWCCVYFMFWFLFFVFFSLNENIVIWFNRKGNYLLFLCVIVYIYIYFYSSLSLALKKKNSDLL